MFPKFFISLLLTTSLLISFVDGIDDTCSADNNPFLSLDEKPLEVDCSQAAGTPEFKLCCEFCHLEGTLRNGTSPAECPPTCIYNDRFYNLLENCRRHRSTCCYQIWDSCPVGMGYDENSQNSGSFLACPPKTFNPPKSEERMRDGKYFVCQECSFRWCLGKKICDPITGEVDTIKCYLGFIILGTLVLLALATFGAVMGIRLFRKWQKDSRERLLVIPSHARAEPTSNGDAASPLDTEAIVMTPVVETVAEREGPDHDDGLDNDRLIPPDNNTHMHENDNQPEGDRHFPRDRDVADVMKPDSPFQVNVDGEGGTSADRYNRPIPEGIPPSN